MEDLRVLVVSDDPLARTGLALLLADREGITVSGQAGADDDWPGPSDPGAPHVVVWDLGPASPSSAKPPTLEVRPSWPWWRTRTTPETPCPPEQEESYPAT